MTSAERHRLAATTAAIGLTSSHTSLGGDAARQPELLQLSRNGWVPNNDLLPVLLYRGAFPAGGPDPAAIFERTFTRNGWPSQWRNDVYTFHHYHSTAHEILGFAAGEARLILGGEGGVEIAVQAGDVIVLPAGCGHCKLDGSPDFLAVGAYPPHQDWDTCRCEPSPAELDRLRHLPFPNSDPVTGAAGALPRCWKRLD